MDMVSGFNSSETYEFVNWDDYFQYMETSNMFQNTDQYRFFIGINRNIMGLYHVILYGLYGGFH